MKRITRTLIAAAGATALLSGCSQPPAKTAAHVVCSDKFDGRPVFAFWEDTATDVVVGIVGGGYATFTLDSGRTVTFGNSDLARYDCDVDARRPWAIGTVPR